MGPYEVLGTLAEGPELTAQVVRRPGEEELLLLNRIPHNENTRDLFRALYRYDSDKPERSELIEMFAEGRDFCALFRYHQGPSLRERFDGGGPAAWRLTVLYDVMFHVYHATRDMPLPVVCSMLQPENILFDENELVTLRWQLCPELWQEDGCGLWQSAADLMLFLAGKEMLNPRYRNLHSMFKRCRAGLYRSVPELLHALKNAGQTLGEADLIYRLKTFFVEQKARLQQSAHLGVLVLLACLAVYVVVQIAQSRQTVQGVPITAIGGVTYISAQREERGFGVEDPIRPPLGIPGPVFTALPGPDAQLDSEDYVVQSGETLEDICTAAYGAEGYAELAASFNGLDGKRAEAGMVLRLPRRDQLSQYLAGS